MQITINEFKSQSVTYNNQISEFQNQINNLNLHIQQRESEFHEKENHFNILIQEKSELIVSLKQESIKQ